MVEVNILDVLLDKNNRENIFMFGDDGSEIEFEQIAVINLDEELYCILKPVIPVEGMEEDEAIVFKVDDSSDKPFLVVVTDEQTVIEVFNEYYDLFEKNMGI